MSRAEVACVQCRRRKIACSKKLPHCTECLVHGRDCCYSRDKRRRVDECTRLSASSISSATSSHQEKPRDCSDPKPSREATTDFAHSATAECTPWRQNLASNTQAPPTPHSVSRLLESSHQDMYGGMIPDAVNDTFWWLATQWQWSLPSESAAQWPVMAETLIDSGPTVDCAHSSASVDLLSTANAPSQGLVNDPMPSLPMQDQTENSEGLYQAYRRCLPEQQCWPKLFAALKKLCQTALGGSQSDTSPFLSLSKLQKQLEEDTHRGAQEQTVLTSQSRAESSPFEHVDLLRRAWTLAALCLANSLTATSPIELPLDLSLELSHAHQRRPTVQLFAVSWAHCRAGLCGDPVEVMQTYRMMVLAFSRCHKGQDLASTCVFLGCRAAATMSMHCAQVIANLGSSLRQQEALNAFWHLVSQGCHFKAWDGRDMPIDMAMVDLPMPDPKSSLEPSLLASSSDATAGQSPRSQLLSSSPVFMTRIWTSVAIGQTIERYYRQGASLLVPCEARLKVAVPLAIGPSKQEQESVEQTTKALDFCASLLQTRDASKTGTREAQLRRFVLMLVRYSRVLLHYPFCRVEMNHRKAAQESTSAIVSIVLGTLLSLGSEDEKDGEPNANASGSRLPEGDDDRNSSEYSSSSSSSRQGSKGSDSRACRRAESGAARPVETRFVKTDRHLLELLAGLSIRALVFTLALLKHAFLCGGSDVASNDDTERQRTDAVLSLRALEQLNQHGVVSASLLRRARKVARRSCGI